MSEKRQPGTYVVQHGAWVILEHLCSDGEWVQFGSHRGHDKPSGTILAGPLTPQQIALLPKLVEAMEKARDEVEYGEMPGSAARVLDAALSAYREADNVVRPGDVPTEHGWTKGEPPKGEARGIAEPYREAGK